MQLDDLARDRDGAAVKEHLSAEGEQTGDGAENRRFAGAVGTDQRHPLAALDGRRDAVHDLCVPERHRDVVHGQGGVHAPILRAVFSTMAKNGAPKNAVMTPIGSSCGERIVRAMTSASTRKAAPRISESGTSAR